MAPRVHAFSGASSAQVDVRADDDEGAPSIPPGGHVTTFDSKGDIVSSTSPSTPEELAERRAALAGKPRKAVILPRKPAEPELATAAAQPPTLSASIAASGAHERALRLRCLELAARGGESDPEKLMARAKEFLAFIDGQSDAPN